MSISLLKGGNVSLTKEAPGVEKLMVGLGWDVRITSGADFDLDASCFMLTADGKVRNNSDFMFYNHMESVDGAVILTGDNRTGEGDGDDEVIKVDLSKVSPEIAKLVFVVTIYQSEERKQNFGQVSNAFIRIVDAKRDQELARFDLTEDASLDQSMVFGELYRHNGEWKFRAIGQGFNESMLPLASKYGVSFS